MDIGIDHGYDIVFLYRLERWVRAKFWRLSPRMPARAQTLPEMVLHHNTVPLHIAQYLIRVTDGWEVWNVGDFEPRPSAILQ